MNNEVQDKDYIPLTPFKGWVLENFPFIEADFDAITNYQLYCKIVEYLNNVINNQNQVQDLGTELVTAYNQLLAYVNNYLTDENLQPLINNKLDDMVEDGTMAQIINDEVFTALSNRVTKLETPKTMIVIGDSYSNNAQSGTPLWYTYVAKWLGLNVYTNASDGVGYGTGVNTFQNQLTTAKNHFTDQTVIDRIYIVGGLNDLGNNNLSAQQFGTAVTNTLNYAKTNFPNIPIYVVGIFPFQYYNFYSGNSGLSTNRAYTFEKYLAYYCTSNQDVCFIPAGTVGLNCNDFYGSANQYNQKHPSSIGEKVIANYIMTGTQITGVASLSNTNWNTTPYTLTNGTNTTLTFNNLSNDCIILKIDNYDNTQQLVLDLSCFPTYRSYAKVRNGVNVHVANIDNYVLSIASNSAIPSGTIYVEVPVCFDPKTYIR